MTRRWTRALPGLGALVAFVIVLPIVLIKSTRWPLPRPDHMTDGHWWSWILHGDHSPQFVHTAVLNALLCIAWLIWAAMIAVCVAAIWEAAGRPRRWRLKMPAPLHTVAMSLAGSAAATVAPNVPATAAVSAPAPQVVPSTAPLSHTATAPLHAPLLPEGTVRTDCGREHVVKPGETLSLIARHCLGSADRWPEIWHLNRNHTWPTVSGDQRFHNPNLIRPHWVLRMPAHQHLRPRQPAQPKAPAAHSAPRPASPAPAPATSTPPRHTIAPAAGSTTAPTGASGHDTAWETAALGGAAALAAAGLWLRRRQHYQPRPPSPSLRLDDPDLRPAPPIPQPRRGDQHPESDAALLPMPSRNSPASGEATGSALPALPATVALDGPGAADAARGILARAATTADGTTVLIPAATLTELLAAMAASASQHPRVHVTATLEEAVALLEAEVLCRVRLLAEHDAAVIADLRDSGDTDGVPATLVLVAGSIEQSLAGRLAAILTGTEHLDIRAVILGNWEYAIQLTVLADSTAEATFAGVPLRRLSAEDAAHLLYAGPPIETPSLAGPPASEATDDAAPAAALPVAAANGDGADVAGTITTSSADLSNSGPTLSGDISPGQDPKALKAQIRVLGGSPTIVYDRTNDAKIILRGRSRELLAYLAAHPGRVTESTICEDILGDLRMTTVKRRLNTYVYNLRQHLTAATGRRDHIQRDTTAGWMRLNPDAVDIDLWRMQRHLRIHETATNDTDRTTALEAALAEYQGPFADGHDYEWIAAIREAVHRQVIDTYSALIALLTEDRPQRALEVFADAIALAPTTEPLYVQGMHLHARLGNRAAIRRLVRDLTRRLAAIDATPTPETLTVAARLGTIRA